MALIDIINFLKTGPKYYYEIQDVLGGGQWQHLKKLKERGIISDYFVECKKSRTGFKHYFELISQ
jgi:predicted transcriptional regulator